MSSLHELPDMTVVAIPLYIVTMAIEILLVWRRPREGERGYAAKDSATSIIMGLGSLVIAAVLATIQLGFLLFFSRFAVADLGAGTSSSSWLVQAATWIALFVLVDFCYYWFHRVHHETRLFWAAHVTHHSSRHYNLSTALRQSWTPLTSWIFYVPVMLVGFSPAQFAFAYSLNLIYQYWIHTERIRHLPRPVEYVFNTPSHHRVHHGSNPEYLDTNYGGILIIWDRMFGSFVPEDRAVDYGLTKNIETYNPVRVAWHEFAAIARDVRRADSWRERVAYVFGRPGWSPAAGPDAASGSAGPEVAAVEGAAAPAS
ncbi:MAG: sterol desaturase family protein [Candidatus Nanopelagicales bacterium]